MGAAPQRSTRLAARPRLVTSESVQHRVVRDADPKGGSRRALLLADRGRILAVDAQQPGLASPKKTWAGREPVPAEEGQHLRANCVSADRSRS